MNDGLRDRPHLLLTSVLAECGIKYQYSNEQHGGLKADVVSFQSDDKKSTINFIAMETGQYFFSVETNEKVK